jgi:hypothetical protein
MTVRVLLDRSPVADLKHQFNNRVRVDKVASGAIELAYLRDFQSGVESVKAKQRRRKQKPGAES